MEKKIILTNSSLSDSDRHELETIETSGFIVRHLDEIKENELSKVEILLFERGEEWLTPERFRSMDSLRLFQNISAGVDHLDFGIIPEKVIVCGNVGAYGEQIAEYVFAAFLYYSKNLKVYDADLRRGNYLKEPLPVFMKGKTVGILGTGGIGNEVARLAKAFGMRTLGINTSGNLVDNFDSVSTLEEVDDLLSQSDFLVVSLPLTNKTRNLLDSRRLGLLKEACVVVNVARGAIIEKEALYAHLKLHPQTKAAIDVWWKYPKQGEKFTQGLPFFDLPNFLGSPHISGDVVESMGVAMKMAIENIEHFARNEPLKGVMDRKEYSK